MFLPLEAMLYTEDSFDTDTQVAYGNIVQDTQDSNLIVFS
jgi:hypothetical protein